NVVHAMIYQIGANRIMSIQSERDFQFRPDTVDARNQNRLAHSGKVRTEQSAETADLAEHLWSMGLFNERLNASLQSIAKIDIDARRRISLSFLCHSERSRGISYCRMIRDVSTSLDMTTITSNRQTTTGALPGRRALWRALRVFP